MPDTDANQTTTTVQQAQPVVLTRDQIRAEIFKTRKPLSVVITFFGQQLELRQPTLADVMAVQETEDRQSAITQTLVRYAFIPKTEIHVFEAADADAIMQLPFGADMVGVTEALEKLTSVNFQGGKSTSSSTPDA